MRVVTPVHVSRLTTATRQVPDKTRESDNEIREALFLQRDLSGTIERRSARQASGASKDNVGMPNQVAVRIHHSTRPMNTLYRCRLTERINGHCFIIHDVKDGVQLCDLQHVVNFTREMQQL